MNVVVAVWLALLALAGWAGWYFRGRLAVRRGESTARAEREAAIRACAKRHRDACAVFQMKQVDDWTGDLEVELKELRKMRQREAKDAEKAAEKVHRKRAKEDEGQDP